MLSRSLATSAGVAALLLSTASRATAADGDVYCPPNETVCVIVIHDPGGSGTPAPSPSTQPGSTKRVCLDPVTHTEIPCYDETFGWWSSVYGCYFKMVDPQPPADASDWQGHYPDGAVYETVCPGVSGTGGGWVWLPSNPPGYGGAEPTPADLAADAVKELPISGPDIGMAPGAGKTGLVGLPVWLWTSVTPETWGPTTATASIPGLAVTATAKATQIVWDMGDGHTVTCANPGTAYTTAKGAAKSPTCGYMYEKSSAKQKGAAFTVTATTTWAVTWAGGGESGALTVNRSSTVQVRIGELQVLVS